MANKTTTSSRRKRAHKKSAVAPKSQSTASSTVATSSPTKPYRVPSGFRLAISSVQILWKYRGVFGALTLLYGVLTLVLVQGFGSNTDVSNLKHTLDGFFTSQFGSVTSSLTVFLVIVSSSTNSGGNGWFQIVIAIIMSLAIIWTLRHVMAGKRATLRTSMYQGMTPLIPFLIVILVVVLQLLPLVIGSTLYGAAMNGAAIQAWEKMLWASVYILFGVWSGYMLSTSIFAIYIVTLPDMTPMTALRSARQLVKGRRWLVARKMLLLPLLILLAYAVVVVPVIMIAVVLAPWVFFAMTCISVVFTHAYMYGLYRELINAQG